jgi:hypothetical protein
MLKYTLLSYLFLTVAMLYFANKMLSVRDNLTKKVLGSYYSQMEEINKESGMEVYNLDNKPSINYKQNYELPEELK